MSDKQRNAGRRASANRAAVATGTRLDPWYNTYADRALGMRQSEVRSLFAVANRPEVVSLAGGMPNIEGLPLEFLAEMSSRLLRDRGASILQYGSGQGSDELREMIVEVMRPDGIRGHADDVVVTTGSQQALDLISQIFINPGDVVLAEAPSYVGALGTFRAYQANVVHVSMDAEGLIPEELERVIDELEAEGKPVKFLYTIPNFHNPGGVCLSAERRPRIAEICQRRRVLVVEDNPYGLLGFDGDPIPAIQSINPDGVVYLGSFSKTFAPGYRVGWALAPTAVAALLASLGVAHEVRDGAVRTPMMPDDVVGELITRIVSSGTTVYRVQTVRKTLEQAFLELTEPVLATQPPLASQEMNR